MLRKTIRVKRDFGPDIIPYLVQSACHYSASIHIEAGNTNINMKSIMGMTVLKLRSGTDFDLVAEGSDEQLALQELAACFEGM